MGEATWGRPPLRDGFFQSFCSSWLWFEDLEVYDYGDFDDYDYNYDDAYDDDDYAASVLSRCMMELWFKAELFYLDSSTYVTMNNNNY